MESRLTEFIPKGGGEAFQVYQRAKTRLRKEEPTGSLRHGVRPSDYILISASTIPKEHFGGPSCATVSHSHPSGMLELVHDAVIHQDEHYKWVPLKFGVHDLSFPVGTDDTQENGQTFLQRYTYQLLKGLANWYTWRHKQVLRDVYEIAKAAVSMANSRTIIKQIRIFLLVIL